MEYGYRLGKKSKPGSLPGTQPTCAWRTSSEHLRAELLTSFRNQTKGLYRYVQFFVNRGRFTPTTRQPCTLSHIIRAAALPSCQCTMKASVFIATASAATAALCSVATGFVFAPTLAVKVRENKLGHQYCPGRNCAWLLPKSTRQTHAVADVCGLAWMKQ